MLLVRTAKFLPFAIARPGRAPRLFQVKVASFRETYSCQEVRSVRTGTANLFQELAMLDATGAPAARDCFDLLDACHILTVVRLGAAQRLPTGRAGRS
jgi:hypothetical protein